MQKKYLVLQIQKRKETTKIKKNLYEEITNIFFYEDIYTYNKNEYFIDITNYQELYQKTPYQIAQLLKETLKKVQNIKTKIGIGTNLFLAKTACDIITQTKKIDIAYLDEKEYLLTLSTHKPLSDFFQISQSMMQKLKTLNIETMKDIRNASYPLLYKEFGYNAEYLINHSLGLEATSIHDLKTKKQPKTISACTIFQEIKTKKESQKEIKKLLDFNILQLKEHNLATKNIYLYIKYAHNLIPRQTIVIKLEKETASYTSLMSILLTTYQEKVNPFIPIEKVAISFQETFSKKGNITPSITSPKKLKFSILKPFLKNQEQAPSIRKKPSFLHT